jgi:PPM family protein phosphatase
VRATPEPRAAGPGAGGRPPQLRGEVAVPRQHLADLVQGGAGVQEEDRFLIAELARTLWVKQTGLPQAPTQYGRNRVHIFLVADGMGGHQAGEVASALTVATIEAFVPHLLKRFSNLRATDEETVLTDFQAALRQADARLAEESAHHPEFSGMGTTLTMALVSGWKLFVFHADDSRRARRGPRRFVSGRPGGGL